MISRAALEIGYPSVITIDKATTVRELLTAYPNTFPILLNKGMCSDCESAPPPVPLSHFADKHCGGDIQGLLEELRRVADTTP